MFIVVAIVIFGIFVSLSYTLFGKTLQPQVVSLFETATEQSITDLNSKNYNDPKWFSFEKSTGTITGFNPDKLIDEPNTLAIPPYIDGVAVKIIDTGAFHDLVFDELIIPDTVETIGAFSFVNLDIENIIIGNNVKEIGAGAFTITTQVGFAAKLQHVTIPDSVENIGSSAFDNRSIKSVTMGKGIKKVGSYAFHNSQITGNLNFPDSLESIGVEAFRYSKITEISVPKKAVIASTWTDYNTKVTVRP